MIFSALHSRCGLSILIGILGAVVKPSLSCVHHSGYGFGLDSDPCLSLQILWHNISSADRMLLSIWLDYPSIGLWLLQADHICILLLV